MFAIDSSDLSRAEADEWYAEKKTGSERDAGEKITIFAEIGRFQKIIILTMADQLTIRCRGRTSLSQPKSFILRQLLTLQREIVKKDFSVERLTISTLFYDSVQLLHSSCDRIERKEGLVNVTSAEITLDQFW